MKTKNIEILTPSVEILSPIEVQDIKQASEVAPVMRQAHAKGENVAGGTKSRRSPDAPEQKGPPVGTLASTEEADGFNAAAAQAMRNIAPPAELGDFLNDLADAPSDEISDEQARLNARRATVLQARLGGIEERLKLPGTREPGNALIAATWAQSLQEYKEPPFAPKWMQVRQLPGYMLSQIRRLGRDVFKHLGATVSLEDIQVITEMTHPSQDVKKMAAIIHNHGQKMREERLSFSGVPCDVQVWRFANFDWVIVEDFGGHYVYGWPENLSLTNEAKAPNGPRLGQTRKLR